MDALSAGQIAGLEFVSLEDLITIAMSDKEAYKKLEESAKDLEATSVYENVDRAIYEKGGVAMTSDALRAKAAAVDVDSADYTLGELPKILWIATAGAAAASIASAIVMGAMIHSRVYATTMAQECVDQFPYIWNNLSEINARIGSLKGGIVHLKGSVVESAWKASKGIEEVAEEGVMNAQGALNAQGGFVNENIPTLEARAEEIAKNQEYVEIMGTGDVAKYISVGFAVLTAVMTIASTVMTLLDAAAFYDTEYTPIPKYMVDEADITAYNEKGEQIMVKNQTAYYKVVTCNRTEGDNKTTKKNYEAMGDSNDLNGDIGSQWLALYAVKYENGAPILADSLLYQKENSTVPSGYSTGIHEFGGKAATNLNNKNYLFRDKPPSIKVFFKTEKKTVKEITATGSIFGVGSLAMGGGIGLVVGALLGALVMGRRKKKITE